MLFQKAKLDEKKLIDAITIYFKNDIFINKTGSHIINEKIYLDNGVSILLHSILYICENHEHGRSINLYIKSDNGRMNIASYRFYLDLSENIENKDWICTNKFLHCKKAKTFTIINNWSKQILSNSIIN